MKKRFLILFAATLFVTAGLASAASITQTQNFSGTPNITSFFTFNQFDSSLGSLTSIQVSLTLQSSGGQLILDNDGAGPASGTFEFGAIGSLSSGDVALVDSLFMAIPDTVGAYHSQPFSLSGNVGDVPGDYDPTAPDGLLYDGVIETDSDSGFVNSLVWSSYTGTGTYDIDYSIFQWQDYGSVGGIEYAVTPATVNGCVTVVYNYNPIPEPATITLLTIGALGFLKRKNSK